MKKAHCSTGFSLKDKLFNAERIVHIATVLENHLSSEFSIAAQQISNALPSPLDPTLGDDDFGDFIFAPLGEYVVRNGLSNKHPRVSLRTDWLTTNHRLR